MHFCTNCHRALNDEAPSCPTCGVVQNTSTQTAAPEASVAPTVSSQAATPPQPPQNASSPPPFPAAPQPQSYSSAPMMQDQFLPPNIVRPMKSPFVSAALNFFFPGFGYIYNGIGVDQGQVNFGILCFLAVFLGLFIPTILEVLFFGAPTSSATGPMVTTANYLSLLILLIPIALAYDGYKRAMKINQTNAPLEVQSS